MITLADKRQALIMDGEMNPFINAGVRKAMLVGLRTYGRTRRAYIRGEDVLAAFRSGFVKLLPQLRRAMVTAYLFGMRRMILQIPRGSWAFSTDTFENAQRFMRKRLNIPVKQLAELNAHFETTAITALSTASVYAERKIERALLTSLRKGDHVKEGIKRLDKAFAKAGIVPDNKGHLETLFRTQTKMAYSVGQYAAAQDQDIDEILWGYKYTTVGDDRVRATHAGMEGVELPKDDPVWDEWWTPNGYNCRCQIIPMFEEPAKITMPPSTFEDEPVVPDSGFNFHPGKVLAPPVPVRARRIVNISIAGSSTV